MNIDAKNPQENSSKPNPAAYKRYYMPGPSGVISRMQAWFNVRNQLNIVHHINRQKTHNYLNRAGKAFNKIQHILMIKPVKKKKLGIEGNF